jgi:hypothetical protein
MLKESHPMPDATAPVETKKPHRLKGALKAAFAKKAPWWVKVMRCTALAVTAYTALEFGVMPNLPGRPLTVGETTELRQIFKDSVDFSKERIHSSKAMDAAVNPFTWLTDAMIYGHTRGNVVIVNSELMAPNFVDKKNYNDLAKEVFFHENVHVWQFQSAPLAMTWATMTQSLRRQGGVDGFYTYHLQPGKDLLDYNIEQQAVIITDYYLKVAKGDDPQECDNKERGPALKALYESTLKKFKENPSYLKGQGYKLR